MASIGVRELRQHASRYLAARRRRRNLEVTDRGRPIALLVPAHEDCWHDLYLDSSAIVKLVQHEAESVVTYDQRMASVANQVGLAAEGPT